MTTFKNISIVNRTGNGLAFTVERGIDDTELVVTVHGMGIVVEDEATLTFDLQHL